MMRVPSLLAGKPRQVQEETGEIKQLVSFRIGGEEFGVDILMVQEIIRFTTITPIPNSHESILGMINLRGRIIPVIDLRKRLRISEGVGDERNDRKTRILIVELESSLTGFIVDAVSEVMKVRAGDIEPAPHLVTSTVDAQYILGVIKRPERLIILLDFGQILKPREKRELEKIGSEYPTTLKTGEQGGDVDISFNISIRDKE